MTRARDRTFLMRPVAGGDLFEANASIALDGDELVLIDHLAQVHRLPLTGAGPPLAVIWHDATPEGVRRGPARLAIVDSERRAVLETPPRLWETGDFARLAELAGLRQSTSAADAPKGERPGCVKLDPAEYTPLSVTLLVYLVPVLFCLGVAGFVAGTPLPWLVSCLYVGAIITRHRVRDFRTASRNLARRSTEAGGTGPAPLSWPAAWATARAGPRLAIAAAVGLIPVLVAAVV